MSNKKRLQELAGVSKRVLPHETKKLKLSSLSERLQRRVQKYLDKGVTRFSEMPEHLKESIRMEMAIPKLSSGTRGFHDKEGNFVPTGSYMGRGTDELPMDKTIPVEFEIENIMDKRDKDYDKGGAYWGHLKGEPVYRAYAELPEEVEFERNGYSRGMQDVIDMYFRAKGMAAARKHVLSIFPNAKFKMKVKPELTEIDAASPYDPEKLKQLWTLNKSVSDTAYAEFEGLLHELFGPGWPGGGPPHIMSKLKTTSSPEEFVAAIEKDRADSQRALAPFEPGGEDDEPIYNADELDLAEDITYDSPTYPELQAIVDEMANSVCMEINKRAEGVQSKMPYKAQWILEELAKELQRRV